MAHPTRELVSALRRTAARLQAGADYAWTHMGACNCGHLAQTLTHKSAAEIREMAFQRRGEWAEQALEWCPGSGYPIDHVIERLLSVGLEREDIAALERLSDPAVLSRLPAEVRLALSYRSREHVVLYFHALADLLEEELLGPEAAIAAE